MRLYKTLRFLLVIFVALVLAVPTVSLAAAVITVKMEKPKDTVQKTSDVKIRSKVSGLVRGKKYIIRIQVFEDGGTDYSNPVYKSFKVSQ
jgi:deoxyinosine 3'endonuclease (endonuclease V)